MSGILKAPWQVGLAFAATVLTATGYIQQTLTHLAFIAGSDRLLEARIAPHPWEVFVGARIESNPVLAVQQLDELMADIFVVVGVAFLILGLFLWVGAFRGHVRGILTVMFIVSFLFALIALGVSLDPANDLDYRDMNQAVVNNLLGLICVLLLWGRAGTQWVAIGAAQRWDEA